MKIKYQKKSEFQHKDDKNYDKDNEEKRNSIECLYYCFIF